MLRKPQTKANDLGLGHKAKAKHSGHKAKDLLKIMTKDLVKEFILRNKNWFDLK